jgi:hypothetical protein
MDRHSMVYDSGRDRIVLVSGNDASTWEWDGSTWTRNLTANHPPFRHFAGLVYDSTRDRTILFGGFDFNGGLNDTWAYDGTNWTQLFPATSPPARIALAMNYDSVRDRVVLFGGRQNCCASYLNDTWEFDGTNWAQKFPATSPSPRWFPEMVYDSARSQSLLYGGYPSNGDFWKWDGSNWTALPGGPGIRERHVLVYNPVLDKTILFGGFFSPTIYDELWEWNGTQWRIRTPATGPAARYDTGAAVDGAGNMVLFGGSGSGFFSVGDTWLLTPGPDSDPPEIFVSSVASPADGLMPAESSFDMSNPVGATPAAVTIGASDDSGIDSVSVGASAASETSPDRWTATVPLTEGENSFPIVATDGAGNDATGVATITLDLDLDDDGIANNIDGNSTVSPAVSAAREPSARFSDKALGGATSGEIVSLGTGIGVTVKDLPSPAGVRVTVTGPTAQRATFRLDTKAPTFKLPPGTYTLTDPEAESSVETTTGGPAEIELIVGGAPLVIVVEAGEQATITERDNDGNGTVDEAEVTPAPGDVVTVNGVPVDDSGQNVSALRQTSLDIVSLREIKLATVVVPVESIDPRNEATTIKVGTYTASIPAGSFTHNAGRYLFSGKLGGADVVVAVGPVRGGMGVTVNVKNANLAGTTNPVTVAVTFGDEIFTGIVTARFR